MPDPIYLVCEDCGHFWPWPDPDDLPPHCENCRGTLLSVGADMEAAEDRSEAVLKRGHAAERQLREHLTGTSRRGSDRARD